MIPGRNEELSIERIQRESGVRLITLSGPLTLRTLFDFQEIARQDHEHATIVEISRVPYMDSAGLGALISVYASCQRTNRGFALAAVPERVRVLLRMTAVDTLLPSFETVDEAEKAVTLPRP